VESGEKIVTNGLQRLRPGMPVIPQEANGIAAQEKAPEAAAEEPAAMPSPETPE